MHSFVENSNKILLFLRRLLQEIVANPDMEHIVQ